MGYRLDTFSGRGFMRAYPLPLAVSGSSGPKLAFPQHLVAAEQTSFPSAK